MTPSEPLPAPAEGDALIGPKGKSRGVVSEVLHRFSGRAWFVYDAKGNGHRVTPAGPGRWEIDRGEGVPDVRGGAADRLPGV